MRHRTIGFSNDIHSALPTPVAHIVAQCCGGLHVAWGIGGGVSFSRNAPVIVALALERIQGVDAGGPLLVSSNDGVSEIVRSLAAEAKRLEALPESISDAVSSLSLKTDGPLAGYLFVYLTRRLITGDRELETSLLWQMIGSPGVPSHTWRDIVTEIGVGYYSLSANGRSAVVGRFVDLALQADMPGRDGRFRWASPDRVLP